MAYWVYQEWAHKKATVHDGDCGYCRHGEGFRKNTGSQNGKWHGPFETVFHALNAAALLHPGGDRTHTCASGPYGSQQSLATRRERLITKSDIEELLRRLAETRAEAVKAEAQLTRTILARLERLEQAWTPSPSVRTGKRAPKRRRRACLTRYWVYENWKIKRVRVHRADCAHCEDGKGPTGKVNTQNGRWHGDVFPDKEAALAYARPLGYPDTGYCEHCLG